MIMPKQHSRKFTCVGLNFQSRMRLPLSVTTGPYQKHRTKLISPDLRMIKSSIQLSSVPYEVLLLHPFSLASISLVCRQKEAPRWEDLYSTAFEWRIGLKFSISPLPTHLFSQEGAFLATIIVKKSITIKPCHIIILSYFTMSVHTHVYSQ